MTAPHNPETFREDDLIERLIEDFGYRPHEAQSIAPKLVASAPPIRSAFWHWWQTGDLGTAPEIEGFTVEGLIRDRGMTIPAAFAALDWLVRDPDTARRALSRRYDRGAPVSPARAT